MHFVWKSELQKNRGQQRTAIIKHICRAADSKWLLTQTMSLLLHQTKLDFKGNPSVSDGVWQQFQWHHYHLDYFVCIFTSVSLCIFSHLNFTPHNIFTPTYRCNWHRKFYRRLFFFISPESRTPNRYLCSVVRKLFWSFIFFLADTLKCNT